MSQLPSDFQVLFPSSDIKDLSTKQDKTYIIQTLLKNSTLGGWKWMLKAYSEDAIAEVVRSSKILTPRETYFWSYFLDIPQNEILCLNKDLRKTQKTSWVY